MNDDQWLRDALDASVPEPPPAPDRAESSRRRARAGQRRRRTAAAAGAAAVVLAGVLVPVVLSRGGSPDPAPSPPVTHPSPDTDEPAEVPCPAPPRAGQELRGPGTLPEGAVAVRLCRGSGIGFQEPSDVLVTGVDELAAVVNDRPVRPEPDACTMDLGLGYGLAFAYSDGSVRTAWGELYGCRRLTVGSTNRANPELPFERFVELLREQRSTSEPPAAPGVVPTCASTDFENGPGLSPLGRPDEMVTGVLCVHYETASDHGPREVAVPDADLATLIADRQARRGDRVAPPEQCDQPADLRLVGATAWGDLTSTYLWCRLWSDEHGHYWRAGPEAQRILDRLVAEVGRPTPTVDAGSTAEEVVAAYVDLLNADDRDGAAALWHDRASAPELPTSYSRIDYKVVGVRELRSISAWVDATAVTALYRVVPEDGSWVDYREATFMLGRDEGGAFRIVAVQLGEVVTTGR